MTKRLLALFLVCILAIPIFVIPASASSVSGDKEYDNWLNLYIISSYIEYISDVMLSSISSTLDSIDSWCDTLWQEIRNQRLWQETTLGSALDTINNNLISFNSNVDLWIEAQTEEISSWLEAQYNLFDGFVTEAFFGFWEDWAEKIGDFKLSVETWFSSVVSEVADFKSNALEYLRKLLNGSPEREQEANEFGESVSTEATVFEDNMEVIDEWTRPDYETDFDPSVEGITDGENIADYTDMLGGVISEFTPVLFMAFAFSLISFVVFGKR